MRAEDLLAKIQSGNKSQADYAAEIERVAASGVIVLCRECQQVLTPTEIVYFENRCERCEAEWSSDISAWRRNEEVTPERAAEFNAAFGAPKRTVN